MSLLANKRILLSVGGGIAAYKAAEIVRALDAAGASVQVAMTPAATAFIAPLTLQALSRQPVATELLDPTEDASIGHIRLAEEADAVLVAPATADLCARMAAGMADDIVTCTLLATRAPVVVAPAMNSAMLEHPATVANLERLAAYGYRIVDSDRGVLACGTEGPGRLPDPEILLAELEAALAPQDLAGVRVLVTSGPTREPIDPVRYITNRSSGRMGHAVARVAARRGAEVTLVTGPTGLTPPHAVEVVDVESAADMRAAVGERVAGQDVVIAVAAVADYRPVEVAEQKIKRAGADSMTLELERTDDVLAAAAKAAGERIVVGFAAETEEVAAHARGKLERKGLDLIVANDVSRPDAGFEVDTNRALLIDRDGGEEDTGLVSKVELADRILDRIAALRGDTAARTERR